MKDKFHDNKRCIITGASSGLGAALAQGLAAQCILTLTGRDSERLESVARLCKKSGAIVSSALKVNKQQQRLTPKAGQLMQKNAVMVLLQKAN